jgi:phosphoenolpyruvate carboxykinase (GTP)
MKQGITTMSKPLTTNEHLIRWVEKMAELTEPAAIHWVDGCATRWSLRAH